MKKIVIFGLNLLQKFLEKWNKVLTRAYENFFGVKLGLEVVIFRFFSFLGPRKTLGAVSPGDFARSPKATQWSRDTHLGFYRVVLDQSYPAVCSVSTESNSVEHSGLYEIVCEF